MSQSKNTPLDPPLVSGEAKAEGKSFRCPQCGKHIVWNDKKQVYENGCKHFKLDVVTVG